jgi:hypothetical protein
VAGALLLLVVAGLLKLDLISHTSAAADHLLRYSIARFWLCMAYMWICKGLRSCKGDCSDTPAKRKRSMYFFDGAL